MIELRVLAGATAAVALTQIKLIATRFPGEHELTIIVVREPPAYAPNAAAPAVRLKLGAAWRYDASPACLSALAEFGEVVTPDR